MPIPKPKKGEKQKDFMMRCVPQLSNYHEKSQAIAICYKTYREEKLSAKTYNDYPKSASNNAKKVIEWKEKYKDEVKGMTRVGWTRAAQLARGANLSRSTIARMAAFKRHEKNASINPKFKATPWKDRGYVAWLGWGGSSGVNWAIKKIKTIDNE